jgi:AcrR family transcriptional regulator
VATTGQAHPRQETARRNRELLMVAALREFERLGPEASLEAIARNAGVGIATLYRHFPSREALIFAVHECEVHQLSRAASELLTELPPERALRAWMEQLATFGLTKRWKADALSAAAKSGPSPSEAYRVLLAALGELLAAGAASGAIRADIGADDMMLALAGLWHVNIEDDWQGQTGRLLDLLMDGLRSGAAAPSA